MFPERFSNLPAYPFARLRNLLDPIQSEHVALTMTIGEPTHAFPSWIIDIIAQNAVGFNSYPPNEGSPELRSAICDWAKRRYRVDLDADRNVIVLNGTREGLYNAAMALCPEKKNGAQPIILTPNPFYQVYMFAALSVGARSEFVPATRETGFLPDYTALPSEVLNQTALAYICSPANPVVALEIAADMGADPERVVIFHSLSKRSNLPGLRSGFAAGGEKTITQLKTMRAYSGAPLPLPLQRAAEAVWADEAHVIENRALYEEKFKLADDILGNIAGVSTPEAGFFLWLPYRDGEEAAVKLWREEGLRVLPGRYLAQDVNGQNPGHNYIRVALVADKAHTEQGLLKIRRCLYNE